MHDDLTRLTDEELEARYARVDRVMTKEAVIEAARITREWRRRYAEELQND